MNLQPRSERKFRPARAGRRRAKGFTLVEILVVLAIIAILAALLFPAFRRAQENGRQASCATNLKQIYSAVLLYRQDEGRYPSNLAVLLPSTEKLDNSAPAASGTPVPGATPGEATVPNTKGSGFLKSANALICPDDDTNAGKPRSSYGNVATSLTGSPTAADADLGRYTWNYWGYTQDGFGYLQSELPETTLPTEYVTALTANGETRYLRNPTQPYDATNNPVDVNKVPRLANRNAPNETIITHCVYHRMPTSNLVKATEIYTDTPNAQGALDIVLRLDGSADAVDVTTWRGEKWTQQKR